MQFNLLAFKNSEFKMDGVNFFAGSNLDRRADMRPDKSCIKSLLAQESTKILLLSAMNPIAEVAQSEDGAEGYKILFVTFANVLRLLEVAEVDHDGFTKRIDDEGKLIFLGSNNSISYFALDISELGTNIYEHGLLKKVLKSRIELLRLNEIDASLVAQSRSLLDWNKRYRFCPTCGSTTSSVDAGYKRHCSNGDCLSNKGVYNSSYPRTDPVVISVVVSANRQRMLLGRKKLFPRAMYSCLAGFVEPGETIEEAVRREVKEESGVRVGQVRYVSSQPWPFPSVLMIGCISFAESEEIQVCTEELEDARWFNIIDIEKSLNFNVDFPILPPSQTIAHQLIKTWIQTSKL